eukprot:384323_1
MKYLSLFALLISKSVAFTVTQKGPSSQIVLNGASSSRDFETFERALDCAEKFGVCDLDQMEELANELEQMNGNYFEKPSASSSASDDQGGETMDMTLSEKEIADRNDLAEVLKIQSELRLRMEYLHDANLFAKDVHDMDDAYPDLH